MSVKTQNISSLIWNTCDDELRGLFRPHEYGSVILPFLVLRRLDCVLEPKKDKIYELYEKYKNKVDDPSPFSFVLGDELSVFSSFLIL